jgi:hypothetical protein
MASTPGELLDQCVARMWTWVAKECPGCKIKVWQLYTWPQSWTTPQGCDDDDDEEERQTVVIRMLAIGGGVREFAGVFHRWRPAYYVEHPTRAFFKALKQNLLPGADAFDSIQSFGDTVVVPKNWLQRALGRLVTPDPESPATAPGRKKPPRKRPSRPPHAGTTAS